MSKAGLTGIAGRNSLRMARPNPNSIPDVSRLDAMEAEALPGIALSEASDAERRWLEDRLALLRAGNNTSRGSFAEVLVAEALPGSSLTGPWSVHDVLWMGYTIQVKCSAGFQYWHAPDSRPSPATWDCAPRVRDAQDEATGGWVKVGPRRWSQIWIFARHEGRDVALGWSFHVVPRWWLDKRRLNTVTSKSLRAKWPSCSAEQLASVVAGLPTGDPAMTLFGTEHADDEPHLLVRPPAHLRTLFDQDEID